MTSDLVLIDLDNTLLDRDAAFRRAVIRFVGEYGLGSDAADWILMIDASGYTPRAHVSAAMMERFPSLRRGPCDILLAEGGCEDVVLEDAAAEALRRLCATGRKVVVVTNGSTAQQERKISRTELDQLVNGWVVSETVGVSKPNEAIYRIAADSVGCDLSHAWMIGDNPDSDIRASHALGCRTVWIPRNRVWPYVDFRPTRTAPDVADAINGLL